MLRDRAVEFTAWGGYNAALNRGGSMKHKDASRGKGKKTGGLPVFLKNTAQILLATLVLWALAEAVLYGLGFPTGGSQFVDAIAVREKLTPRKPAGEYRIFSYGESTMHGCHYAPVSSPAKWLDAYLKDYHPGKKIRTVNFARMGKGSDFTLRTFEETLTYRPNLAVFYLGHNDYSKRYRMDETLAARQSPVYRLREAVKKSRLVSAVSRAAVKIKMKRKDSVYTDEVGYDLIETPVYRGMGDAYQVLRTDPFYFENIGFFKENILKITALARRRGIPVIFYVPVSNLKDFAPNQSRHQKAISAEALESWEDFFRRGKALEEQGTGALELYEKAYAIDPTYAELCFRMARILFNQGELERARVLFEEARDYDAVPLRAVREIEAVIRDLPRGELLEVIDTEKAVIAEIPGAIPGEPVIEDNVHFSIRGHALLAKAAALAIAERGWLAPGAKWQWKNERPFDQMAAALGVDDEIMFSAALKMVHFFGDRFENRVRFAEKAIALKPRDPRGYRSLAWTYWLMGESEKALQVYRQLGELAPAALAEVLESQPSVREFFETAEASIPVQS